VLLLLLGLGLWQWPRQDRQEALVPPAALLNEHSFRPPRGASENPADCPSPPELDIAFVRIPDGEFSMGEKRGQEKTVRITKPYCLGAYEVTQELWNRVMGIKEELPDTERYLPKQGVNFDEAQQFMDRLNEIDPSGHYRLPTEAEWEHGARAGTRTRYSFGDDAKDLVHYANCKGKDRFQEAAPVGQLNPNNWSLYDMYGNVFEWVSDSEGEKRIRRGGGWDSSSRTCSSGNRSEVKPNSEFKENGFRIVRVIR
jgi:formylglycine-generating enzyme required for sulfatase activity